MTEVRRPRRPRQSDIAEHLGLSQATVSAVINSAGPTYGVSEETRTRVLAVAERLGYVADPSARKLRGKRNRLLGVHTFEPVFPVSSRDFYHDFLVGIEEQAVVEGYDLVLFTAAGDATGGRPIYVDGGNRLNLADGAVLLGVEQDGAALARLHAEGYPFVHVGRREVEGHELACVGADYAGATEDVVARLAALGHTEIAYLAEPKDIEPMLDRRAGYRAGCERTGLTARPVEPSLPNRTWLARARASAVTAVLTECTALADEVGALADDAGLTIPGDLSVVVLNDDRGARQPSRAWSAIGIPRDAMGRQAVRMLIELLDGQGRERLELLPCSPPGAATMARTGRDRPE